MLARAVPLLALVALVRSQATVDGVQQEQTTLSENIPGDCSTDCQTWLTTFGTCTGTTEDVFQPCVCDATFQSNFQTCATCFTTVGDANAATAQTAVTDLTNYCAGVIVTSSSTTDALTTSSTTEALTSSTTTTPAATSSSSSSSASAADSTSAATSASITNTKAAATIDFPTQTKSSNVFAGAAPAGLKVEMGAAALVGVTLMGVVAGGMALF
ncbi:hypothetical protein JCM8547_003625 [Rhodosporidiobolus lusitaniae]